MTRYAWMLSGSLVAFAFAACGGSGDEPSAASGEDGGTPPSQDAGETSDGGAGDGAAATDDAASDDAASAGNDAAIDTGVDAGPAPTFSVYDDEGRLAGQYDAVGAPVVEVVWLRDTPIALMTPGATYTVQADHLGTPRALVDSADHVVWRWDGDAFGSSAPDEDTDSDGAKVRVPLRFPGQVFDGETGLHHNGFRDYDPTTGRFLQPDPLGLRGGVNVYAYANESPLRFIDPSGLLLVNLFPPNEGISSNFESGHDDPNVVRVGAHGSPHAPGVEPRAGGYTAEELARLLIARGLEAGIPVVLDVCFSTDHDDDDTSFAQDLANALRSLGYGNPVFGSDRPVWVGPDDYRFDSDPYTGRMMPGTATTNTIPSFYSPNYPSVNPREAR